VDENGPEVQEEMCEVPSERLQAGDLRVLQRRNPIINAVGSQRSLAHGASLLNTSQRAQAESRSFKAGPNLLHNGEQESGCEPEEDPSV
jgi:hypothetical protein